MITERLLSSLRGIVGGDGVVSHATELSVYDCDGYTLEKSTPEVVVLPRSTDEVAAVLKLLAAEGVPFVPRGTGTGLSGGCLPLGAPGDGEPDPDEPDPGAGSGQPPRRGRKRRGQLLGEPRGQAPRPPLRARPIEPDGLLHRRQRGRERRRPPHPQVRRHHQPRARRHAGAAGRRGGPSRRHDRGRTRIRPCRRHRRLGGGPSASSPRQSSSSTRSPKATRRFWPCSTPWPTAAPRWPASSPAASCPPRWRCWTGSSSRRWRTPSTSASRARPARC